MCHIVNVDYRDDNSCSYVDSDNDDETGADGDGTVYEQHADAVMVHLTNSMQMMMLANALMDMMLVITCDHIGGVYDMMCNDDTDDNGMLWTATGMTQASIGGVLQKQ